MFFFWDEGTSWLYNKYIYNIYIIYIYIQICSFLLQTQEHPPKEPEELGAEAKDTGECGRGNKGVWKGAGNQKKHAGRPLIYGGFWPGVFWIEIRRVRMWLIGFFLSWFFWWLQDPPADLPTEQLEAKDQGADVSHEAAQDNWWYIGWGTGEGCYSAKKCIYTHGNW